MRIFLVLMLAGWGIFSCSEGGGDGEDCLPEDRYIVPFGEADTTFHVGPYLEHTTTTTVAVGWETLAPGATRLEYGQDASYGQVVEGEAGTMHQVVLEDLSPATRYHYRACSDDTCTGDLVLATAPEAGRPVRFSVYGDTQDNPDQHRLVAQGVMQDEATMAIVVGDTVSDGNVREQFKERFFDPARALAHSIPRWAAVGNHDRKDTECVHFIDYHIFPEDPGVPQAETSYSFVYGDAFFLVYDNTLDHYDFFFPLAEGMEPPLWVWLQEQVASPAARNARWRFAFAHYPPHSNCREDDYEYGMPESAVAAHVLPLLWQHGFHAHFSGHVHCYERLDFDGHLAFITGGGGGGLEPQERCDDGLPQSRVANCVHHHMTIELGCDDARIWARDVEGDLIDELTLHPDGTYEVP